MSHSQLPEIRRVVFEHHNAVVVLSTGEPSATWMLAVLAYSSVPMRYVASQFSRLPTAFGHLCGSLINNY